MKDIKYNSKIKIHEVYPPVQQLTYIEVDTSSRELKSTLWSMEESKIKGF